MKKLLLSATLFVASFTAFSQVGIGTTDPKGALDVESQTLGFIVPRVLDYKAVTATDGSPPINGSLIYDTTLNQLMIYIDSSWLTMGKNDTGDGVELGVIVPTVPNAPIIGTATPGVGAASITFTAPLNDGGSPITQYTATSSPEGHTGTLNQAGSGTITVTGLTGGSAYTFSVTATNAIGASATSASSNSVTPALPLASCTAILAANPASLDGVYTIDLDGLGTAFDPMDAQCDMTTDGGGWTLLLNYVHQGGADPAINEERTTFPVITSSTLGGDESAVTASWGGVSRTLKQALPYTELRFYGETSQNTRIMNFSTTVGVSYSKTGNGDFTGLESSFTALTGHTTNLPLSMNGVFPNEGAFALTELPFWKTSTAHWGISGQGDRWQVDEATSPVDGFNTIHRVWARGVAPIVPDVPTIGTATPGAGAASIPFTAPLNDGGSPITQYTATSSGGQTGTLNQAGSGTITVTGLTGGTAYTFSITATNAVGISAASANSNSVTPVVCGANVNGVWKEFLCHNLGANTALDPFTYQAGAINGDYYQWGRQTDGHELSNSTTEATQATNNAATLPASVVGKFIIGFADWRSVQTDNLWGDGTTGADPAKATNDPCPTGYKVPSTAQLAGLFGTVSGESTSATQNTWNWTGNGFMVGSSLYLPAAGVKSGANLSLEGTQGLYFSSTANSIYAHSLRYASNFVYVNNNGNRADGYSVRCISE